MNSLKLYEYPDLTKCRLILNHEDIWNADRKKLLAYVLEALKNKKVQVNYFCGGYGRLFGDKYACANMWNKVRSTLFKNTEYDIDIVNAHYNIFMDMCKAKGLSCPLVELYCKNRDEIIEKSYIDKKWLITYNRKWKKNETKKGVVKMLFTCFLFGGGENTFMNHYNILRKSFNIDFDLKGLKEEISRNTTEILKADENKDLIKWVRRNKREKAKKKLGDNYDEEEFTVRSGSLLSYVLQEQEKILVRNAIDIFTKNKVKVTSYIYDGFTILKENIDENKIDELLDLVSDDNIRFIRKPFCEGLDMNKTTDRFDRHLFKSLGFLTESEKEEYTTTYYTQKAYFDLYHFKLGNPCGYGSITGEGLKVIKYKDIMHTFVDYWGIRIEKNKSGEDEWVRFSFIKDWVLDDSKRSYDGIDSYPPPLECPHYIYNTWTPFDIENYDAKKEGDISRILHHFTNLANKDDKVYEYLLNWFAHIVQRPAHKTRVMIILYGIEGTGKSIISEELMKGIAGEDKCFVGQKVETLFGRFSGLQGKLFITYNEGNSADTIKYMETIKDQITRNKGSVEQKGLDSYQVRFIDNYIMTTNQLTSIPITTTNRRIMPIKVNYEIANNKEYFDALYRDLTDKDILKAFYEFLMSRNIDDFDAINHRPETKLTREMKRATLTSMQVFMINLENEIQNLYESNFNGDTLYNHYKSYCNMNGYDKLKKKQSFLAEVNSNYGFIDKKRFGTVNKYVIDKEQYEIYMKRMKDYI